jgi:hypothetical protein
MRGNRQRLRVEPQCDRYLDREEGGSQRQDLRNMMSVGFFGAGVELAVRFSLLAGEVYRNDRKYDAGEA